MRGIESIRERVSAATLWSHDRIDEILERLPIARAAVTQIVRVEVLDRSLILAAQALFALTPLLVVLAAFTPDFTGNAILDQLASATGISKANDLSVAAQSAATSEQVRSQTGLIGIVLVIISALSFARAMQRLFERVWEKPHRGGVAGTQRCLLWLAAWVVYVQLIVAIIASLGHPLRFSAVTFVLQIVAGTCLWWWTAYTLLLGRVPRRRLGVGAALTAIGLSVQIHVSHLVMPSYTKANVDQFGSLGVVFAASTWLLVFGGVIVVGNTFGRVIVEDPVLQRAYATFNRTTARS